jgi:hypothetical protein
VSWDCSAARRGELAKGSAACLVKYGDWSGLYLLSCHHVLALSEVQVLDPSPGSVTVGYQLKEITTPVILPARPWQCDAAVVRSPSSMWTPAPEVPALTSVLPAGQDPPATAYALTRNGSIAVSAVQRIDRPHIQEGYFNGAVVTFPRIIQATATNSVFEHTDSGALIVSADGVLVGMHFAGAGAISYAVPMADVMAAFPMQMTLWTG